MAAADDYRRKLRCKGERTLFFTPPFFEGKCPKKWSDSVIWKVRGGFLPGSDTSRGVFMFFWTKRFFNVYIPGVGVAPINIGWGATSPKGKRRREADVARDSLFFGIRSEGNTLLTARCSLFGEIVCLPCGAENFTTLCLSKVFCRSPAKNHSGVRHFRESTGQTRFEPETSRSKMEKSQNFHEKSILGVTFLGVTCDSQW